MPLFMDVHEIDGGVAAGDVAQAHEADLRTQARYGVNYLQYWVDETSGKVFCLVDSPDPDAATHVHREAHGLVADAIYPVVEGQCPEPRCAAPSFACWRAAGAILVRSDGRGRGGTAENLNAAAKRAPASNSIAPGAPAMAFRQTARCTSASPRSMGPAPWAST